MKVLIASDHGGFELKQEILLNLEKNDIDFEDLGCNDTESVDYPDFAKKVAKKVSSDPTKYIGILVCGTGIGMSMTANKFKDVRAALCHDEYTARMAREHNDANILCIGGRVVDKKLGVDIVKTFLETHFSDEERHKRRITKIG